MRKFVHFMVNTQGRILRVVAGLFIIATGLFLLPVIATLLVIIGLIPLAAGLFDFCLLAPLFGYHFSGKRTRKEVNNTSSTHNTSLT
jgi:hypothetical protein